MRRFLSRDDFSDLESELRDGRPEPRAELLDELVSRVERVPVRIPARRPRLAAALVFAVVVLVALAAFGGVGYAKSSLVSAARDSGHAVGSVVNKGDGKQSGTPIAKQSSGEGQSSDSTKSGNDGPSSDSSKAGSGGADNGNEADSSNFQAGNFGGNWGHHNPPWMHQYSRFVLVCYPFTFTFHHRTITIYRTIIVPRLFLGFFVPPGTPGRCVLGPQ